MKPIMVVPHYIATPELRRLAVNALKSLKPKAYILSVDDGSPLNTEFLDELSDATIHLSENSGFAKACNVGFKFALEQKVKYIGCANNDIQVRDDWLEALIEPYKKWDNVGITGMVETKDFEEFKTNKGRKITEGGLLNDSMQSGALWLMPKRVMKEILIHGNVFDERFEIGGEEDVDLFLRLRDKHGKHIIMTDKSLFWHKQGATRWNDEIEGFKEKNKAIEQVNYDKFAEKWGFDIRSHGLNFYEHVLEP